MIFMEVVTMYGGTKNYVHPLLNSIQPRWRHVYAALPFAPGNARQCFSSKCVRVSSNLSYLLKQERKSYQSVHFSYQ